MASWTPTRHLRRWKFRAWMRFTRCRKHPDRLRTRAQAYHSAARNLRLPSASDDVSFARAGGLLSLGIDEPAVYPGAAHYIDRILKGAKIADLPVVLPSK